MAVGRAGGGEVIVSGSNDGTVQVWDAVTGQPAGPAADWPYRSGERGGGGPGREPRCDRLRRRRRDGADLGRGDRTAGGPPLTGHTGQVIAVAVGRAGDRDVIVSGSGDETVRVWDAVTGQLAGGPLTGHTGRGERGGDGPGRGPRRDRLRRRSTERCGCGTRLTGWPTVRR